MINIELNTNLSNLPSTCLVSLVGSLINNCMDEAWSYDIDADMADRISEVLNDHDIKHSIVEGDDL